MAQRSDADAERRRRAEELVRQQPRELRDTPGEIDQLIHELQVHQIELEMQNEELLRTQLELAASRDRYVSLFDFAPVGYLALNREDIVLEANLTLAAMLKADRAALLQRSFTRHVQVEDQAAWRRLLANVFAGGGEERCELLLVSRGGQPWTARLDLQIRGVPPVAHVTVTDVSERKRAEAERLELERRLLHAQKLESLGVMAGGVAHDFNNLLTVMQGGMELALGQVGTDSGAGSSIRDAMEAGHRAAELTQQMLDFAGTGNRVVRNVDLGQSIRESSDLLRACIPRTVDILHHLAPMLPAIQADPSQIQQVVMNLITNASEAISRAGTITIATGVLDCSAAYLLKSRLEEKPPPGRYVYMEVTDTGSGMESTTLERLFDPFFTTKFLGRGLGMSAAMGIVRRHGGAILVDTEVGVGTSVRVLFPAAEAQGSAAGGPAPQHVGSLPARSLSGTVLVVDDEPDVRRMCQKMVEKLGLQVITAKDGEDAIRVFREHRGEIACVILDLTMPRMDGVAALAELKLLQPDVKVILASGYADAEVMRRFTRGEPAAFLHKPYGFETVAAKLREVLG